jgi:nitroimidazol reductase NimA-like FMN-containing flavoprotein (pyridoxamine 5'-phosphate oxidase superfamily)
MAAPALAWDPGDAGRPSPLPSNPGGVERIKSEVMTRNECLDLLTSAKVGRIGLSVDALPVILPMAFALLDDDVVIRTGWGVKLDAAVHDRVVCFEADGSFSSGDVSWSVLVTGRAELINDPEALERVGHLSLRPWAVGDGDRFIRIPVEVVSGRRIRRPAR